MAVFLSTDDGRILLADPAARSHAQMADFAMAMTDVAVTEAGTLLGSDDRRVYRLNIAQRGQHAHRDDRQRRYRQHRHRQFAARDHRPRRRGRSGGKNAMAA